MRLGFLGTRGARSRRERVGSPHGSLLFGYRRRKVMVDCGLDWLGRLPRLRPAAIVITDAHPITQRGFAVPCPVYAPLPSPSPRFCSLRRCSPDAGG